MVDVGMGRLKLRARCYAEGCNRRAKLKHECRVCETLCDKGRRDGVFVVETCHQHQEEGIAAMKKHTLTHPSVKARWVIGALAGEDVS